MSADEPDDIVATTGIGPGAEGVEIGRFKRPRPDPVDELVGIVRFQDDYFQARARLLAEQAALPPFELAKTLAAQWEHSQRWIAQINADAELRLQEIRATHDRIARSAFSALHYAVFKMPDWIGPADADQLAARAMELEGHELPPGADYATAHRDLAQRILYAVAGLPDALRATTKDSDRVRLAGPDLAAMSPDERDQWAGRSAAEDGGTDAGILWLSERLARHIETIGTDRGLAKEVADLWRTGERDRRRKASAGNPGSGYLFRGWGLPAVMAPTTAEVDEAEAWPPKAWQAIARASWIAGVRPPLVARAPGFRTAVVDLFSRTFSAPVVLRSPSDDEGEAFKIGAGGATVATIRLPGETAKRTAEVLASIDTRAFVATALDTMGAFWRADQARRRAGELSHDTVSVEIAGGLDTLKTRYGVDHRDLSAALEAGRVRFVKPDGGDVGGLWTYETFPEAKGRPSRLVITSTPWTLRQLRDTLEPGERSVFFPTDADKIPRYPVVAPRIAGRAGPFYFMLWPELADLSRDYAQTGAFHLPDDRIVAIGERAHLKPDAALTLWRGAYLADGGKVAPTFRAVGRERYDLTELHADIRALLVEGGKRSAEQSDRRKRRKKAT